MLDQKLTQIGKLTMENGKIQLEGFDVDDAAMCREVAAHALLWAIGELQKELTEIIARPGGSGICSLD
ncbi:hypothetical protein [Vibrio parahaemolyticus]|uniref:hypothetical protein n=1 Tax=Vibrio parahaemolyticus TaxID=670 RepID=UPI001A260A5A|nr:hypothetical protein [Vibrio parahaemolyticus]